MMIEEAKLELEYIVEVFKEDKENNEHDISFQKSLAYN